MEALLGDLVPTVSLNPAQSLLLAPGNSATVLMEPQLAAVDRTVTLKPALMVVAPQMATSVMMELSSSVIRLLAVNLRVAQKKLLHAPWMSRNA